MPPSGHKRPQFTEPLTSIEICAGAGGQAVGLHNAGFDHLALVEWDQHAVSTLRANVGSWPGWTPEKAQDLQTMDVKDFLASDIHDSVNKSLGEDRLDLFAGGVPCPPFSLAGKQLGADDERDLFPAALSIIEKMKPNAIMIENVRGILEPPELFIDYRRQILNDLRSYGYVIPEVSPSLSAAAQDRQMRPVWRRVDAKHYGVPQLRPRAILVAIHKRVYEKNPKTPSFHWPTALKGGQATVAEKLADTMRTRCMEYWDKKYKLPNGKWTTGKEVYETWLDAATKAAAAGRGVAPTLVGGSRKHGGADLGPTRAKRAWEALGVDAMGVANDPDKPIPERDLFRDAGPMLTVEQAAIIQGFPQDWKFQGLKTARYRQVGNAFPPPVAEAIGRAIAAVLRPAHAKEMVREYETGDSDPLPEIGKPHQKSLFESPSEDPMPTSNDRSSDLIGTNA
jgi:DNA (cytosine-5)-methyltransferase 1